MMTYRNIKYLDKINLTESQIKDLSDFYYGVHLPIHTGDIKIRQSILGLPETIKEIVDACTLFKKYNLKIICSHTFGLPMESDMSNDISLNLYTIIKADFIECKNFVYEKGSPVIKHAIALGIISPAQAKEIESGIPLKLKNTSYYAYAKSFIALPVGGLISEILPMCVIKAIAYIKAGLWRTKC